LTFYLLRVKRKGTIKTHQTITAAQKMGVTEKGTSMSDESKKGRITQYKGDWPFLFCERLNIKGVLY